MMWLRSLAFNIAFFCWTSFIAILLLPALALPRMVTVRTVRVWVRGVFKLQRITGQRIEIRSRERVPPGPVIVASKHQSVWDTLIFNLVLDDPSFVLKRDLYRIPAFGWELRHAGMIAIDRKAGASALRDMVRDARAIAKSGRPIVIFPGRFPHRAGPRGPLPSWRRRPLCRAGVAGRVRGAQLRSFLAPPRLYPAPRKHRARIPTGYPAWLGSPGLLGPAARGH